jgi:hypothetical protein
MATDEDSTKADEIIVAMMRTSSTAYLENHASVNGTPMQCISETHSVPPDETGRWVVTTYQALVLEGKKLATCEATRCAIEEKHCGPEYFDRRGDGIEARRKFEYSGWSGMIRGRDMVSIRHDTLRPASVFDPKSVYCVMMENCRKIREADARVQAAHEEIAKLMPALREELRPFWSQ